MNGKMSLKHEFLIIPPEQIITLLHLRKSLFLDKKIRYKSGEKICWPKEYEDADDILLNIMTHRRRECSNLHDDVVRPILHKFEDVDTLYGGFIPYSGLNYYGFTLIPYESIPSLLSVLKKANKHSEFDELIEMCIKAIEKKQYILHVGV